MFSYGKVVRGDYFGKEVWGETKPLYYIGIQIKGFWWTKKNSIELCPVTVESYRVLERVDHYSSFFGGMAGSTYEVAIKFRDGKRSVIQINGDLFYNLKKRMDVDIKNDF